MNLSKSNSSKSDIGELWKDWTITRPCIVCKSAHSGCDGKRPCGRCIKSKRESECVDPPIKKKRTQPSFIQQIKSKEARLQLQTQSSIENVLFTPMSFILSQTGKYRGTIVYLSEAVCNLLNLPMEDMLGKLWTHLVPPEYLIYAAQGFYSREAETVTIQSRKVFEMEEIFTAGNKYLRVMTRHDVVYKGLTPISNNITIIKCLGYIDPKEKPFPLVEEVITPTDTYNIHDAPPPILTTFFPRAKEIIEVSLPNVIEDKPIASTAKSKKRQDSPPQPESMICNNPSFGIIDLEKLSPASSKLTTHPKPLQSNLQRESKISVPLPCNSQQNLNDEISVHDPILYSITQNSYSNKHFHHNHNTSDYVNFVGLNSNMPSMNIINNNIHNITNYSYPGKYETQAVVPMVNTVHNGTMNYNYIPNQISQEHQDTQYINDFWDFNTEIGNNL